MIRGNDELRRPFFFGSTSTQTSDCLLQLSAMKIATFFNSSFATAIVFLVLAYTPQRLPSAQISDDSEGISEYHVLPL